ncbi:hypothetical protein CWI38_1251p0020 [Hamiltosporidium tvaerminnensis]|uniref:Uncharacterized protein n=1 Tax=Hamiltosporidium tvaerminnensis TaxID=1176355 RepID=A0A4Q9LT80_9MICR|nr:hypothetical protein CWI38_1251p0020 [Hamiltosporidium tvaerminnensis]
MFLSNLNLILFTFIVYNRYNCTTSNIQQSEDTREDLKQYFKDFIEKNDHSVKINEEYTNNNFIIKRYIFGRNLDIKDWLELEIKSDSYYYMICLEATDKLKAENTTLEVLKCLKYTYERFKIIENKKDFSINTDYTVNCLKDLSALGLSNKKSKIYEMMDIYILKSNSKEVLRNKSTMMIERLNKRNALQNWRLIFVSDHILEANTLLSLNQKIENFISTNNYPFKKQFLSFVTKKSKSVNMEETDYPRTSSLLSSVIPKHFISNEKFDKQNQKLKIQFEKKDHSEFKDFQKNKLSQYVVYQLTISDMVFDKSIEFLLLFKNEKIEYITSPKCNWILMHDTYYYKTNDFIMKTFKHNIESVIGNNLIDIFGKCINILKFCEAKIMFAEHETVFKEIRMLSAHNNEEVSNKFKNFFENVKKHFEKEELEMEICYKQFCEDTTKKLEAIPFEDFYGLNISSWDICGNSNYEYSKDFDCEFAELITNIGQDIVKIINENVFYNCISSQSNCGMLLRFSKKDEFAFELEFIFSFKDKILNMTIFSKEYDFDGNADNILGIFNTNWPAI